MPCTINRKDRKEGMTKENKPLNKKKYEPPSITGPESGAKGEANFVPLGATGCNYGDIGSACANGIEPQGGPTKCGVGSQPEILNCSAGTTAGEACVNGTDALTSCDVGTAVLGDCTRGNGPLGPACASGTSATSCSSGTGV